MKCNWPALAVLLYVTTYSSVGCDRRPAEQGGPWSAAAANEQCTDARRNAFLVGLAAGVSGLLAERDVPALQQTLEAASGGDALVFLLVATSDGTVVARVGKRIASLPDRVDLVAKKGALTGPYMIGNEKLHRYVRPLTLPSGRQIGELWAAYNSPR